MKHLVTPLLLTLGLSAQPAETGTMTSRPAVKAEKISAARGFFESGVSYLSAGESKAARIFLEKARAEGEDEYARSAALLLVRLDAESGKDFTPEEPDSEDQLPVVWNAAAEGWDTCLSRNPANLICAARMREFSTLLSERFPDHALAQKARLRLALLDAATGRNIPATERLVAYLRTSPESPESTLAWFHLGRTLENTDPYRAAMAYDKALTLAQRNNPVLIPVIQSRSEKLRALSLMPGG